MTLAEQIAVSGIAATIALGVLHLYTGNAKLELYGWVVYGLTAIQFAACSATPIRFLTGVGSALYAVWMIWNWFNRNQKGKKSVKKLIGEKSKALLAKLTLAPTPNPAPTR